jgi:hypothetical protein
MEQFSNEELNALFAAVQVAIFERDKHPGTKEFWENWEELEAKLENMG